MERIRAVASIVRPKTPRCARRRSNMRTSVVELISVVPENPTRNPAIDEPLGNTEWFIESNEFDSCGSCGCGHGHGGFLGDPDHVKRREPSVHSVDSTPLRRYLTHASGQTSSIDWIVWDNRDHGRPRR